MAQRPEPQVVRPRVRRSAGQPALQWVLVSGLPPARAPVQQGRRGTTFMWHLDPR